MGRPIPDRMYDSTSASDIPAAAVMVAFYDYYSSSFPSPRRGDRFYVQITKGSNGNVGDVMDVESGAASLAQVLPWVRARRAAGATPVVYAIRGDIDAIKRDCDAAGMAYPLFWIAAWDNDPTIPGDCVAKQFANSALTGGHWDLSSVRPSWPGLAAWAGGQPATTTSAPAPPPPPPPPPQVAGIEGVDMKFLIWNGQQQAFYITPAGMLRLRVNNFPAAGWATYDLRGGCVPGALDVQVVGTQLQVVAMLTSGGMHHRWQNAGQSSWAGEDV